jgi:hypothetical protein
MMHLRLRGPYIKKNSEENMNRNRISMINDNFISSDRDSILVKMFLIILMMIFISTWI